MLPHRDPRFRSCSRAADSADPDPLAEAQQEIADLKEKQRESTGRIGELERVNKKYRSRISKLEHELVRLRAAQETRSGVVSFMGPKSGMWSKEVDTHINWLERYDAANVAELCVKTLYRMRGEDGAPYQRARQPAV